MDGSLDSKLTGTLDVSELRKKPTRFQSFIYAALNRLLPWVRKLWPIVRLPFVRLTIVTRFDDVQEVLRHDRIFQVEGDRITRANGGLNFLLGMQDDAGCPHRASQKEPGYRAYQAVVMKSFRLEDLPRVAALAEAETNAVLSRLPANTNANMTAPELDAIQALLTHVPIAICREYYGLDIDARRPDEFANWTFAISRWLFDPLTKSRFESVGLEGSARLNALIERSMAQLQASGPDTVLRRLVDARVDPDVIRVILFGMVTGFVPTNTMAGGHMLDMLLAHPEFMAPTVAAARGNDTGRLERCLFEAMRFAPLLREPLRCVAEAYTVAEGSGFWHEHRFERGDRVLAMTASAMMDERRVEEPERYNPDRPEHELMLFGSGLHRCIGAPLATTQLVHTFKPLLQKNQLRRAAGDAGKLQTIGPFPEHLFVRFDA